MARAANRIRRLRKRQGLTQQQLGERISVTYATISRWEGGSRAIPLEHALALARLFEVSVEYLMADDGANGPEANGDEERAA